MASIFMVRDNLDNIPQYDLPVGCNIHTLRPGEEKLQGAMARDVIRHGGTVVTVSEREENVYGAAAHIQITGIDNFAACGIPFIYIPQMTALLKSESLGGNPDQPNGLEANISLK